MSSLRNYVIENILPKVEMPGQYIGKECNSIIKKHSDVDMKVVLAFPDTYSIGMSHAGIQILYGLLNDRNDTVCERSYAPLTDMEALLREHKISLFSLETYTPLKEFDVVGFSVQYELSYTNILNMLDLSNIPLMSAARYEDDPLVIAGGAVAISPEPLAEFIDVFLVGDGEESLPQFVELIKEMKRKKLSRREKLFAIAQKMKNAYVPSQYDIFYNSDHTIKEIRPKYSDIPFTIRSATVEDLNTAYHPTKPIMPFVKTIHDRISIEIMRGCTQGCRFCQAGMSKRPTRPRTVENILHLAEQSYANTGHNEISLMSLSVSDYPHLELLMEKMNLAFTPRHVNIAFPSLRVNEQLALLPSMLNTVRKSGLTIALEAAKPSLRKVINKNITNEDFFRGIEEAFKLGWNLVKLYFMIGLPTETDDDIEAIAELAYDVSDVMKKVRGNYGQVNISVAPFIPKAHTPYQWQPMVTMERIKEIREKLYNRIKRKSIRIKFHKAERSIMEGIFARGDRRLGKVIYHAWRSGCKFDAWEEHFQFQKWMDAFQKEGIDWKFYIHRSRSEEEIFPWGHINCGVVKPFLLQESERSSQREITQDCRLSRCPECGSCSRSQYFLQ
ncbi:MAG: TIGR03960 family B12-binding radical SAM protein [Candidatus Kuenenia sp.]|nr:TIGR03960 family B12-binding radical SAM protein [Candidatus Kuenenia hertensis]